MFYDSPVKNLMKAKQYRGVIKCQYVDLLNYEQLLKDRVSFQVRRVYKDECDFFNNYEDAKCLKATA